MQLGGVPVSPVGQVPVGGVVVGGVVVGGVVVGGVVDPTTRDTGPPIEAPMLPYPE